MLQEKQPALNLLFCHLEHAAGSLAVTFLLGAVFFGVYFFVGFVIYNCVGGVGVFKNQIYGAGENVSVEHHAEGPFGAVETVGSFAFVELFS